MTTKVLGLVLYANLSASAVSDAAAGPALRPRVLTGQSSSQNYGDGAVWTAQPSSDQWDGSTAPQGAWDALLSAQQTNGGPGYAASPFLPGDNRSAIAQYQFYASMLALPYRSTISLYA